MRNPQQPSNWSLLSSICVSAVDESVISILRVNAVVDRDTFVNMFDTETALKDGAADREFARVVTAWNTAKVMAETANRCFCEGSRGSYYSSSMRLDVDSGRIQEEIRLSYF